MRIRLGHIGFSLVIGLVAFVAGDVLFSSRLIKNPDVADDGGMLLARDSGWYELKKNFSGVRSWGPARYQVITDQYGFRADVSPRREAASFVVLGDSFAFGVNGAWPDTFVGMFSIAAGVGVINTAVESYSPTAYLYQYHRALATGALTPHHTVIVALDLSDIQDEATRWESATDHPVDRSVVTSVVPFAQSLWPLRAYIASRFLFTKALYRLVMRPAERMSEAARRSVALTAQGPAQGPAQGRGRGRSSTRRGTV